MKKFLKWLLIILLISLLSFEVYIYFFKDDNGEYKVEEEKIETKYLADIYTSYMNDNLDYNEVKESEQVYYKEISGLKNKEVEKKINQKIKEKIDSLKYLLDDEHSISNTVVSNFENTLSMAFCLNEKNEYKSETYPDEYFECYPYQNYIGTLNLDLTTGNVITISDIFNSKNAFKEKLVDTAYEDFMTRIGFVCGGGPCENPNPDYGVVEDELLQIMNKFNKGDYQFSYNPKELIITFSDVDIYNPSACYDNEDDCYKVKITYGDWSEEIDVRDYHNDTYTAYIELFDLLDNLTIYDKFKTNESIYEKASTEINRKFVLYENLQYEDHAMIENEKELIDYDLINAFNSNYLDKVRNMLLEEMISSSDKFSIYNVYGDTWSIGNYDYSYNSNGKSYNYVYFDVLKYELDKNIYLNNRKQIYLDKYHKIINVEGIGYNLNDDNSYKTYPYLKDYLTRQYFFYYVFDEDGKYYDSEDILSKEYLKTVIPEEWYTLGEYKNIDDMVKKSLIMNNEIHSYPNVLVIYDLGYNQIKLKYKGSEITLCNDYSTYRYLKTKLYR